MKTATGAQIVWESLLHEGVEVVFGLPGGAILPVYDALAKYAYLVSSASEGAVTSFPQLDEQE